jgi:hypothetical protein
MFLHKRIPFVKDSRHICSTHSFSTPQRAVVAPLTSVTKRKKAVVAAAAAVAAAVVAAAAVAAAVVAAVVAAAAAPLRNRKCFQILW